MGVTISYRGSLADIGRVEDFEDRVLDLALEVGGHARVWRSVNDDDPRRVVRGVMLDLYPGQETTSLLISPEGWLINLFEIEDAEKGRIAEPPWCFVKTQFGPVEGHVALVERLVGNRKQNLRHADSFLSGFVNKSSGDRHETCAPARQAGTGAWSLPVLLLADKTALPAAQGARGRLVAHGSVLVPQLLRRALSKFRTQVPDTSSGHKFRTGALIAGPLLATMLVRGRATGNRVEGAFP